MNAPTRQFDKAKLVHRVRRAAKTSHVLVRKISREARHDSQWLVPTLTGIAGILLMMGWVLRTLSSDSDREAAAAMSHVVEPSGAQRLMDRFANIDSRWEPPPQARPPVIKIGWTASTVDATDEAGTPASESPGVALGVSDPPMSRPSNPFEDAPVTPTVRPEKPRVEGPPETVEELEFDEPKRWSSPPAEPIDVADNDDPFGSAPPALPTHAGETENPFAEPVADLDEEPRFVPTVDAPPIERFPDSQDRPASWEPDRHLPDRRPLESERPGNDDRDDVPSPTLELDVEMARIPKRVHLANSDDVPQFEVMGKSQPLAALEPSMSRGASTPRVQGDWNTFDATRDQSLASEGLQEHATRIQSSVSAASQTEVIAKQLALEVSAPPKPFVGQRLPIRFHIVNEGPEPADDLRLLVDLPESLSHPAGATLEYNVDRLAPESKHDVKLTVRAEAAGEAVVRARLVGSPDVPESASTSVVVQERGAVIERIGYEVGIAGRAIEFRNLVKNLGSQRMEAVTVIERLPADSAFVRASHEGQFDAESHTVTWQLTIPAAGNVPLSITVRPRRPGGWDCRVETHVAGRPDEHVTARLDVRPAQTARATPPCVCLPSPASPF